MGDKSACVYRINGNVRFERENLHPSPYQNGLANGTFFDPVEKQILRDILGFPKSLANSDALRVTSTRHGIECRAC